MLGCSLSPESVRVGVTDRCGVGGLSGGGVSGVIDLIGFAGIWGFAGICGFAGI